MGASRADFLVERLEFSEIIEAQPKRKVSKLAGRWVYLSRKKVDDLWVHLNCTAHNPDHILYRKVDGVITRKSKDLVTANGHHRPVATTG